MKMRTTRQQLIRLLGAASLCAAGAFQHSPALPSLSRPGRPPRNELTRLSVAAPSTELRKKEMRTLQRFLEVESWKLPEHGRPLSRCLLSVSDACRQISRIVKRAKTDDLYGAAVDPETGEQADVNVQGEVQQQLDVLCNTLMLKAFCGGSENNVCAVASEEEPDPRTCADVMGYDLSDPDAAKIFLSGKYIATFDPIDGSKNIDASLPVGTIFGVYHCPEGVNAGEGQDLMASFMKRGTSMVAAGYCLYAATTVLVLTMGSGTHGFTLDPDKNMFLLTHPNMKIPDVGAIFSFNEAYAKSYPKPVNKFLDYMKSHTTMGGKPVSCRHIGAMVGDVHNVLINGGVYGYPGTLDNPNGKLRLMYESACIAMIMEQAGGAASTGTGRLLDEMPEGEAGIHARVPTFLGSADNIYQLVQFFREEEEAAV